MMKFRYFGLLLLMIAAVSLPASPYADRMPHQAGKEPNNMRKNPVTLQLNWKYQFEFAGYIAALEKGFYRDAGLEVRLKEIQFDMNSITEVLEGRAHYGVHVSNVILERLKGRPLVMLANDHKHSPVVLLAQPGINSPKDLKGKRIMGKSAPVEVQ
ncbi:MAG: ABC transporter substrate-binding protein, partial [bacterium]|nr:ABC transporter substrate-binding protein [bacterium]